MQFQVLYKEMTFKNMQEACLVGTGFVEMEDPAAAAAIEALDNTIFGGRTLRVNEAKPRAPRPRY